MHVIMMQVPSVVHVEVFGLMGSSSSPAMKISFERTACTCSSRRAKLTLISWPRHSSVGTLYGITLTSDAVCIQRAAGVCTHTGSGSSSLWTRCMPKDNGSKLSAL